MSSSSATSSSNLTTRSSSGLKVGTEIGRGSFATVFKGEYKGQTVAVKSVLRAKLSKKLLENLESEISILKDVKHAHIVELVDFQQTNSHFHLIMEYCSMGDLSYFIRKKEEISESLPLVASLFERYPSPQGLHEDLARHFLKQLASALSFLRSKNLVHRDIKPQNLLLCPPKKTKEEFERLDYAGQWELPVLKLADFGFARILPSTSLAETLCGSPLYMAPEILRYEKYNAKADLWSVGAVLFEMVAGKPPFKAANHVDLLRKIEKTKDKINFSSTTIEHTTSDIRELIKALLKKTPSDRMGFNEFFQHPVLQNDISAKNTPLDRSKLDENLFISEYITTSTSTNQHQQQQQQQQLQLQPQPQPQSQQPPVPPVQQPSIPQDVSSIGQLTSGKGKKTTPPDQSLEHEYVVVEKRTVEVNALADELAQSPTDNRNNNQLRRRSSSPASNKQQQRRRSSIVYGTSPTSALAKALNMASARLFGTKVDTFGNTLQVQQKNNMIISSGSSVANEDERKVINDLESLATKAKVINLFAEVKFSQLIPNTPDGDINLDNDMILVVSEEALVLYVKTLALLARAMDKAAQWWKDNELNGASPRLNDTVQWIRDRFNECLERAEYSQSLFEDAKASTKKTSSTPLTAEKLIFDRALEMARSAAVNELVGTAGAPELESCELSYGTAVWMMEALLEEDDNGEGLDEEDRAVVEKFISSISHRLFMLRKKLEVERTTINTTAATERAISSSPRSIGSSQERH